MQRRICPVLALVAAILVLGAGGGQDAANNAVLFVSPAFEEVPRPTQIRVSAAGEVFLLTAADHSVVRTNHDGEIIQRFGRIGSGPGELYRPADFDLGGNGDVWVADQGNDRVVRFGADGAVRSQFDLPAPLSISVLQSDEVAVVSEKDVELIRVFSSRGVEVKRIGHPVRAGGIHPVQDSYFNRGRVLVHGQNVFYMFRALLTPTVHRYAANGVLELEIHPTGEDMDAVVAYATELRKDALESGALAYSATLNTVAIDPWTEYVWIAPAGPVLYVHNKEGRRLREWHPQTESGRALGAQVLAFGRDGTGYMVAGRDSYRFVVPGP